MTAPLRKNDIVELTDVEHVIKRPGIYIGSVKESVVPIRMYEDDKMVIRETAFLPGLQKIIEEVIDNCIDESIKTGFKYGTTIEVKYDNGIITVRDDGRGLPIEKNGDDKWIPEIIFTKLRSGSNFDDDKLEEQKGQNGVGVSLTNIFSKWFRVRTANGALFYEQTYRNSTMVKEKPTVRKSTENFTEISFEPNYDYFKISQDGMNILPQLIFRYLKNSAFCYPEICFKFNGKKITATRLKIFLQGISENFEYFEGQKARIGVFYSDTDFDHLSFVNGLETRRGGSHIDYLSWKICDNIREFIKRKHKLDVKPADIKSKLFIMFSMRMPGARFNGQTKEELMNSVTDFKDIIEEVLNDKFLGAICRNADIIDPIVETYKLKEQVKENLALKNASKTTKKIRVEKYLPATKEHKYLVLAEGDSAVGGISAVLGREQFGFFPLKGKPLNAFEAATRKIVENDEIKSIRDILNLNLVKDKQDELRYQNVLLTTDQDADGIHIRSLLLGFFHRFSPSLVKSNRIKYMRTPLIALKKKDKIVHYFFDFNAYNDWLSKNSTNGFEIKYYKGLGSFRGPELKELIVREGIDHFIQDFEFDDDAATSIKNWLSATTVDERKKVLRGNAFVIDAM